MIVRSMSPKEVADDARKDLRALVNKLKPLGKRMERDLRIAPKGIDRLEQAIKWRSPRGNEWILVLIRSKRSTQMAGLVRYHGRDKRLRAVRVDLLGSGADIYLSAHFFERYFKRFNQSNDPIQRLFDFFSVNHTPTMQGVKQLADGTTEVFGSMFHGNATGIWDPNERLTSFTTFLDKGLLGADQQAMDEALDMKRYFEHFSAGQRQRMLLDVEAELWRQGQHRPEMAQKDQQVLELLRQWTGLPAGR
ncbi:MAG: hypothetical protein IPI72_13370 [Flavobacteriales bacterium]|nr:hypothetical protein [Flavobacteriales bacterium]